MRLSPERFKPRTERVITRFDAIYKNWRWARRLGFDRLRTTDEALVATGTHSNPTEGITHGQRVIRELVAQGERALWEATLAFERADYCFEEALKRADNRSPELRESDIRIDPNTDEPYRWVSKRERRRLVDVQDRRRERGEDTP